MNEIFPIALFVLGIAIGAIAIWLGRASDTRSLDKLQAELTEAISARSRLEAQLAAEKKAAGEKLSLLDDAQQRLSNAFAALSAQALTTNNQSFLELAKTTLEKYQVAAQGDLEKRQQAIDQTIAPVRESLKLFDAKVNDLEVKRTSAYSMLTEQLKTLESETSKLGRALRTPVVRGRWGEIQLKRVVEIAGMLSHCDFYEQPTATTEDGRLRPDMVIKQPGNKNIVVDAKTPLDAYLNSLEASDDESRRHWLKVHAQNVRTHIAELAQKKYWEQFDSAPEFVVMFLPGEMFFSAALEGDPTLIESGVAQKVIPASPTTLIALLRAVSYSWRQESIAKDARAISALGGEIYKRLSDLGDHFVKLGSSLRGSVDAYNRAVGTLENRVLVSARKLKESNAITTNAEMPELSPVDSSPRALQAPEIVGDRLFPPEEDQTSEDEMGGPAEPNRSLNADVNSVSPSPVLAETKTPASPKSRPDPS